MKCIQLFLRSYNVFRNEYESRSNENYNHYKML